MFTPRVADLDVQDRPRVRLIGQQADLFQFVVEPALAEQQAVLVERVSFARFAEADHLQDARELVLRPDAEAEGGDRLAGRVTERTGDEHRRQVGPQLAVLVREQQRAAVGPGHECLAACRSKISLR